MRTHFRAILTVLVFQRLPFASFPNVFAEKTLSVDGLWLLKLGLQYFKVSNKHNEETPTATKEWKYSATLCAIIEIEVGDRTMQFALWRFWDLQLPGARNRTENIIEGKLFTKRKFFLQALLEKFQPNVLHGKVCGDQKILKWSYTWYFLLSSSWR